MSGHTPGPWKAAPSKYREGELIVQAGMPSNRVISVFGDVDPLDETDRANARLIAAAPELLEALQDAYNCRGGWDVKARAAITKATQEGHS